MKPTTLHTLTIVLNAVNGLQLAVPLVFGTSTNLTIIAGIVLGALVSVIHVFVPAPSNTPVSK